MDWTTIASLALGWLGQHAKAYKQIPTPLVQAVMFVIALGFYALDTKPTPDSAEWFKNGVAWAMAVLGLSSLTGATGLAPKTDSK